MAKESLCWLNVLLKISNPSQIRKYTENLLLEDSRAFHLKEQSINKLPLRDLVLRAALVRKKWNLEYLKKVKSFDLWVDAYFFESVQSISNLENRDLLSCYQLNWSIRKNKQLEEKFWEVVRESTAKNAVVERIQRVYQKGSYARCLIMEALNGVWSNEAFYQDPEPRIGETSQIPYLHLWVQDIHVWGGYNRIKMLGASYLNNTFKQDQLDLRASGMVVGVGYRHRANEGGFTINGYSLPTWESIPFDAKSWQKWLHLDHHFYPKLGRIIK